MSVKLKTHLSLDSFGPQGFDPEALFANSLESSSLKPKPITSVGIAAGGSQSDLSAFQQYSNK